MSIKKRGKSWQIDLTRNGQRIRETHPTRKKATERHNELSVDPTRGKRVNGKRLSQ
jgi:hypothetical protein